MTGFIIVVSIGYVFIGSFFHTLVRYQLISYTEIGIRKADEEDWVDVGEQQYVSILSGVFWPIATLVWGGFFAGKAIIAKSK